MPAGYAFDLGDQGSVRVVAQVSRSKLLACWHDVHVKRAHEARAILREEWRGKTQALCHHEEIREEEGYDSKAIPMHVVSAVVERKGKWKEVVGGESQEDGERSDGLMARASSKLRAVRLERLSRNDEHLADMVS